MRKWLNIVFILKNKKNILKKFPSAFISSYLLTEWNIYNFSYTLYHHHGICVWNGKKTCVYVHIYSPLAFFTSKLLFPIMLLYCTKKTCFYSRVRIILPRFLLSGNSIVEYWKFLWFMDKVRKLECLFKLFMLHIFVLHIFHSIFSTLQFTLVC